ncbi:PH domain-containing protein [Mucisphaera calidilacus]|uniref:Bacterial membrane flanked domain protein n=1 Tax=Mucisphaera calidilacus TaxID=2527982 RepID=A0A518BZN2_9BACT|nr:PH domain-containing protein [Mucisphaera calidilacus]QDU72425.1 Bacterial membrane flanked domain protein [Mucisphaera calidilacus]
MRLLAPPSQRQSAESASGPEAAADSPPLVSMVPPELLESGEIIIFLIKPSLWFIVLTQVRNMVGVGVVTGLAYVWDLGLGSLVRPRDIVLVGLMAMGLVLLWGFCEWLSRTYILTDRRVITLTGVLRVQVFEAALERVQHTRLVVSLRERVLNLGTVSISTAGTAGEETVWQMLSNPLEVHQQLLAALRRYRRG